MVLALIAAFSVGLGHIFNQYYNRWSVKQEGLIWASVICACGYILILTPCAWYLRTFNSLWTVMTYIQSLALVFILVSTKWHLVSQYPNISDEPPKLSLFVAYISAAMLEEFIKLVVYMTPIIFLPRYRTVYDLVFLAISSGCSFATIENLIVAYLGVPTALNRFVWCTATHSSDCVVGALILAHIKTSRKRPEKWYLYPFILIVPIILHGTYDYVLFVSRDLSTSWIGSLSVVVGVVSIALAVGLFFPFRRKPVEESVITSDPCLAYSSASLQTESSTYSPNGPHLSAPAAAVV